MPAKYAERTEISAATSQHQITQLLQRFGASRFGMMQDEITVGYMFVIGAGTENERRIRYTMVLPAPNEDEFTKLRPAARDSSRTSEAVRAKRHEQEINRRWRALLLGIKGKLVLVSEGVETIEEAFWAHVLTPSGTTIYEATQPAIAEAYRTGSMPPLLPGLARPVVALEGK